ncbi:MAG: ABC transporter substrate-binding protein [Deltaproteobacteria bacterium]|nr:ABC transporter substrate-binding protein [Deltaproteobacteria bacterium]
MMQSQDLVGAIRSLGCVLVSCLLSAGCSLVIGPFDECTADGDCAVMGQGQSCVNRVCQAIELDPRCKRLGSKSDDTIVYGAILPLTTKTGAVHGWGPHWAAAVELAFEQLSPPTRSGVRGGRPLGLIMCDSAENSSEAKILANQLVSRGVQAIISNGSGETIAISSVTIPNGVLLLSGASTSPEITTLSDASPDRSVGMVWRTTPSDAFQGQVLAAELSLREPKPKVAILARDDAYGQGLALVFSQSYSEGERSTFLFPPGGDVSGALAEANAYGAQVALVLGFPDDVIAIVNGSATLSSLSGVEWLFTQGGKSPKVLSEVTNPDRLQGAKGSSPATANKGQPAYEWLVPQFEQKYQVSVDSVVDLTNMFDAGMLLAIATDQVLTTRGEITGTYLAQALTLVSDPSGVKVPLAPPQFNVATRELGEGRAIDVVGTSGDLNFDPVIGEAPAGVELWEIRDGGYHEIAVRQP